MKKLVWNLLIAALPFFVFSCTTPQSKQNFDVAVSWKLITNFADQEQPVFRAAFTLGNQGDYTLTDSNWKMYFSMAPRKVIASSIQANVNITCLGGDFYEMSPRSGFSLPPNESLTIAYEGETFAIKEADAPMGVYFVYGDADLQAFSSVTPDIAPFTLPEQLNRHHADEEPIPTAARAYHEYNWSVHPRDKVAIVPTPVSQELTSEKTTIDNRWGIAADEALKDEADYLYTTFLELGVTLAGEEKQIELTLDKSLTAPEAYRLEIMSDRVVIAGSDPAGVFYGIQSIRSLLPVDVFSGKNKKLTLPLGVVKDQPRYAYRGMHVDVGRNFQQKETIFKLLDMMALYKLNKLLFYLTEDEGWRIEIKQLPELAEAGGRRGHTIDEEEHLRPAYGSGIDGPYGSGYYTQDEYIEILKYAHERHIEIIPEVNFPGHSRAAIKAMNVRYNRLMAAGDEKGALEYLLIDPQDVSVYESAQGYTDNVVCVCRESVYTFYETVIDEFIAMHERAGVPLRWFHTGGDEVAKGAWSGSPMCKEFIANTPEVHSVHDLQPYFLKRANAMLTEKGIVTGGWEEVALKADAKGTLQPNPYFAGKQVVPYVWQNIWGNEDLGYKLANGGYPLVLCNVTNLYFDLAYNKDPREPGLYWAGFINTRSAWEFVPEDMFKSTKKDDMGKLYDPETNFEGMEKLRPSSRKNILGIQGQLWCETVKGPDMLEYYYLPKLLGLAERAWSPHPEWAAIADHNKRNKATDAAWMKFAARLGYRELPRLNHINGGYTYRVAPPGGVIREGRLFASMPMPGFDIRYTTDGSEPTVQSSLYTAPVAVKGKVKIRAFDQEGNGSLSYPVE